MQGPVTQSRRGAALKAQAVPKKILMMGGTRFIGLYLARKLVQEGHEVTLFTRGKADICPQIPDDTPDYYRNFSQCASGLHPMLPEMCLHMLQTERKTSIVRLELLYTRLLCHTTKHMCQH